MNTKSDRLKTALEHAKHIRLAADCLAALDRSPPEVIKSTSPLPIKHVRRVVALRSANNARRGGRVQGLDELDVALGRYNGEAITNHGFDSQDGFFIVFTDPAVTQCIGVTFSPGKSLAEFATSDEEGDQH